MGTPIYVIAVVRRSTLILLHLQRTFRWSQLSKAWCPKKGQRPSDRHPDVQLENPPWLAGFTMVIFYCQMNLPDGYLLDRLNRLQRNHRSLSLSLLLWAISASSPSLTIINQSGRQVNHYTSYQDVPRVAAAISRNRDCASGIHCRYMIHRVRDDWFQHSALRARMGTTAGTRLAKLFTHSE